MEKHECEGLLRKEKEKKNGRVRDISVETRPTGETCESPRGDHANGSDLKKLHLCRIKMSYSIRGSMSQIVAIYLLKLKNHAGDFVSRNNKLTCFLEY